MHHAAISNYRGSKMTASKVAGEIKARFGEQAAQTYDPYTNCLTFRQWQAQGCRVKKGEKSIRSITYIEKKDESGNIVRTYPKIVHLFFVAQIEKINQQSYGSEK